MRELIVGTNDAGQRLDKFLTKAVPSLPQALLYKYIRLKRIKVNGKRSEIRYKLALGDKLSLYINDEFFERPKTPVLSEGELSVVYEDENLLIADKPAGLLCHEGREAGEDTLIARIQAYLVRTGAYRPEAEHSFAPALCHRIDRGTSGLVIAAKTAEALRILCEKIKLHEIQKTYLCIAVGEFQKKSGRIQNYLYKNEAQNRVYAHDRMILPAVPIRYGFIWRGLDIRCSATASMASKKSTGSTGRAHRKNQPAVPGAQSDAPSLSIAISFFRGISA